jgi:Protein of unknown function (DUF3102)
MRARALTLVPLDHLDQLARTANVEHAAYEATQSAAIAHAINAGQALIEAKHRLAHGEWLGWLEANVEFSDRTARIYMRIAANRQRVANMGSVREAIVALTPPEPKPQRQTVKPGQQLLLFGRLVDADGQRWHSDRYVPQARDPKWHLQEAHHHIGFLLDMRDFQVRDRLLGELRVRIVNDEQGIA